MQHHPYLDEATPLPEGVIFVPCRLYRGVLPWEHIASFLLLAYVIAGVTKFFEGYLAGRMGMAVGPAIFSVFALVGAVGLFTHGLAKIRLRAAHRRGQYRWGIFLGPDELVVRTPRLERVYKYAKILQAAQPPEVNGQPSPGIQISVATSSGPKIAYITAALEQDTPWVLKQINERINSTPTQVTRTPEP